jgi:hypothetical protein
VYFSDEPTATDATSDYSLISNVRLINGCIRDARLALLPFHKAPVPVEGGNIRQDIIEAREQTVLNALTPRQQRGEISQTPAVYIKPDQAILTGADMEIKIEIVPVGKPAIAVSFRLVPN